jgi:hypothetical protein
MAQRVNALNLRLGLNTFWPTQWYSKNNYSSLFFEDNLLYFYFKNIFEKRGFFFKRILIKRTNLRTFIFIEVYGNPYFKFSVPKEYRKFKKFHQKLKLDKIKKFLTKLSNVPVYLSINNLFIINRVHRNFMRRLQGQFYRYKHFRFTLTVLGIFSIVLRTKGASFLSRIISYELEFIEKKKKNKNVWKFISFIGKLVESVKFYDKAIHGIRIQLKGRFKGIKRPKKVRYREGMVPFNTLRAIIDYSYSNAVTINGSFGIKVWICYKDLI